MNALQLIALGMGGLGVGTGSWMLRSPQAAQRFLRQLPRNERVGRVLMAVNVAWSLWLFNQMNLYSWNARKPIVLWLGPLIYWFIIRYVNQYLGARSLAWLLILAAKPVLNVCLLRDEPSRLVVTVLACLWVVLGICFFCAPHWFRDWIAFWQATPGRWTWGCRSKVAFGGGLILLALFVY